MDDLEDVDLYAFFVYRLAYQNFVDGDHRQGKCIGARQK
jgi:hypothetical protein